MTEQGVQKRQRFFWVIVIAYLLMLTVFAVTRLSLISFLLGGSDTREFGSNFIPLKSVFDNWRRIGGLSWDAIGNLVVFIPLGIIFCYFQRRRSFFLACISCFSTSIGIELCQFILNTGAVDIDDVILNSAGGALGALIYGLINLVCTKQAFPTKDCIAVGATVFPPFLLFYLAYFTWGAAQYHFVWWHSLPILAYFGLMHLFLLSDLTTRQKMLYYSGAAVFSVIFFGIFL